MQLFVNYWSTALVLAAAASETQLKVPANEAAKLVGLEGGEDFYLLTLFERDPYTGIELRREIVRCTGVSAGTLVVERGQEGTSPGVWDAGALIQTRITAATLEGLRSGAVQVSPEMDNQLQQRPDGLYVPPSDWMARDW